MMVKATVGLVVEKVYQLAESVMEMHLRLLSRVIVERQIVRTGSQKISV